MATSRVSRPQHQAGFTLIEVLVALTLFAVGFAYASRALSGGFFWLERSRDETAALEIAEAILARIGGDLPLADGQQQGRSGLFSWKIDTTPYGEPSSPQAPLVGHQVVLTVEWVKQSYARQVRLVTVRLGPSPKGV